MQIFRTPLRAVASFLVLVLWAVLPLQVTGQEPGRSTADLSIPSPEALANRDLSSHPRLLASSTRFDELRRLIETDSTARHWYAEVKAEANAILDRRLPVYRLPDGYRLLSTSNRVKDHVRTLALVYRMEGEEKYARRCWHELKAAADFPDWNPKHFLDVAEMTHAFAIGYDWLYDYWSSAQRREIRSAIVRFGLTPAMEAYRGEEPLGSVRHTRRWWVGVEHNWNQVVNGGVGIGALAVMEAFPEISGNVLHEALSQLPLAMQNYAPDGGWDEGPGYWGYATRYNTFILSALQTSYGTTFGLSGLPGFSETGGYALHMTGPLGRSFNFSDNGDAAVEGPQLFWLADYYDEPAYAAYQKERGDAGVMSLVWYRPSFRDLPSFDRSMKRDRYFRGTEVATFRSAWQDPSALYAGIMAGDNEANHSNLDLGTFVLDAQGVRWATELGSDDYNLKGYFADSLRWTYYRLRTEGQNTLVLNPSAEPSQAPDAAADIERFESTGDGGFAIADLSPAYAEHAEEVRRGLKLTSGRRQVLVQDEIEARDPTEVWWFMHTRADVEVSDDGRSATLRRGGETLRARLLSPSAGRFTVRPAAPLPPSPDPEGQAKNEGVRKLSIHVTGVAEARIAVLLTPQWSGDQPPVPEVNPLARW